MEPSLPPPERPSWLRIVSCVWLLIVPAVVSYLLPRGDLWERSFWQEWPWICVAVLGLYFTMNIFVYLWDRCPPGACPWGSIIGLVGSGLYWLLGLPLPSF